MKFQNTNAGFKEAREYLISIGEWERVSMSGFSTDGYTIVAEANCLYEKKTLTKGGVIPKQSDSIPVVILEGSYRVSKETVAKYGDLLLRAINKGGEL